MSKSCERALAKQPDKNQMLLRAFAHALAFDLQARPHGLPGHRHLRAHFGRIVLRRVEQECAGDLHGFAPAWGADGRRKADAAVAMLAPLAGRS